MTRIIRYAGCSVVAAGLALVLVADATAQRPAVQQSLCSVEIQVEGQSLLHAVVGPESAFKPVDRRARKIVGREDRGWAIGGSEAVRPCTSAQLRNVSADNIWVAVDDLAAALDGAQLKLDRGQLSVSSTDQAGGGDGTGKMTLAVAPDADDVVISSQVQVLALDGVDGESTRREEDVQLIRFTDLTDAMAIEPGDMFIEPGDLFVEMDPGPMRPGDLFIGLKSGPGAGCTLCAFDAFLD